MTNQEIANTIWHQIRVDTKMAVGARQAEATKNGLRFIAGGGAGPKKWITVTLTPADEYDVEYVRSGTSRNTYEPTTLAKVEGIYVDQLNDIIYDMVNKQSYAVEQAPRKPTVRRSKAEQVDRAIEISRAFMIGQEAFRKGLRSVPVLDPALMEFLKGYSAQPGHDAKLFERLLTAWAKGWNTENAKRVRTTMAGGKKRHGGTAAHRLRVISLHDAQAECSCGGWHYVGTGARTRKQIEEQFRLHTRKPHWPRTHKRAKKPSVDKQVAELKAMLK